MQRSEFRKLAKHLLTVLPSYEYGKPSAILFKTPVGNICRGFLFESSGFSRQVFYPQVFVQPLYIPVEHFTLNFGKRFSGNWEYEAGKEELLANAIFQSMEKEQAFQLLEDLSTPQAITRNLFKYHSNPKDPYFQQAIAYSYAVAAQYDEAIHWLDKCCETLRQIQQKDPVIKWPAALLQEVSQLNEAIRVNPEAGRKLLDEWTEFTKAKLGLPE